MRAKNRANLPSALTSPTPSLPLGEEGSLSIWKTVLVVQLRNFCYLIMVMVTLPPSGATISMCDLP